MAIHARNCFYHFFFFLVSLLKAFLLPFSCTLLYVPIFNYSDYNAGKSWYHLFLLCDKFEHLRLFLSLSEFVTNLGNPITLLILVTFCASSCIKLQNRNKTMKVLRRNVEIWIYVILEEPWPIVCAYFLAFNLYSGFIVLPHFH